MTDIDQIQDIIMQWADRCSKLRRLDPSRREFANRVRSRIYEVMQERISPMRLDTLKEKNPKLHERLILKVWNRVKWLWLISPDLSTTQIGLIRASKT